MKNKNTIQKKDVKRFFLTNLREAAPMLCFIVAYFVSFSILENMTRLHYYVISSPLDHMIPFCEVFVLPYFSWFPYMVIGAGLLLFFDFRTSCTFGRRRCPVTTSLPTWWHRSTAQTRRRT